MNDLFWFQDPKIIFRKDKILEVWPYESMTFYEKLNATTRFIILISLLGFMLLNNYLILLLVVYYLYINIKMTNIKKILKIVW